MIAQAKTIDDARVLYTSELMKRVSIDTMNAALEKPQLARTRREKIIIETLASIGMLSVLISHMESVS